VSKTLTWKWTLWTLLIYAQLHKNHENTVLSWGARQCFPSPLASGACCPLPKNPPCSRPLALISALWAYSAVSSNSLLFIGYFKENLKIHTGVPSLPALPFFPSPAFPSLSPSPPFLYPLPLEVGTLKSIQLRGLGERCKLP